MPTANVRTKAKAKAAAKPKAKPGAVRSAKAPVKVKAKSATKPKSAVKTRVAPPSKAPVKPTHAAAPPVTRPYRAPIKEVPVPDSSMTKKEVQRFEKMLLDERARLLGSIRNIEEASRQEAGRDNNGDLSSYAETGTDNFELETALNIASGESEWLRNIADALRRIEEGRFGVCEMCDQPILKRRLEVFPSARYCSKCQAEYE